MKPLVITALFAAAAVLMAFQSAADPLSPPDFRAPMAADDGGGEGLSIQNYADFPSATFGGHEGLPWGLPVSRNAIHSLDEEVRLPR